MELYAGLDLHSRNTYIIIRGIERRKIFRDFEQKL